MRLLFPVFVVVGLGVVPPPIAHAQSDAKPVTVERVKPTKDQKSTLKFLRSNVAFLRAQLDALREKNGDRDGRADLIDPHQLYLDRMMADALAAKGTADSSSMWLAAQDYLAQLEALVEFETRLDEVSGLLDTQADRVADLQRKYLEQQGTAIMILASGARARAPKAIVIGKDDERTRVALTGSDVTALADGGLLRLWHEFVEPREHVIEVRFEMNDGSSGEPVFLTIDPEWERLMFVELDLSSVGSSGDATGLRAKSWTGSSEWTDPIGGASR